jgi:hypothetical protein
MLPLIQSIQSGVVSLDCLFVAHPAGVPTLLVEEDFLKRVH